jgi:hypothetical protein
MSLALMLSAKALRLFRKNNKYAEKLLVIRYFNFTII